MEGLRTPFPPFLEFLAYGVTARASPFLTRDLRRTTAAMVTPTNAKSPNGNSGTASDWEMTKVVWAGRPGPPAAFIQQVTTWYTPVCVVSPVEGAPMGAGGDPVTQSATNAGAGRKETGNQAALFGRPGPQPTTITPPVVPESSKDPGPPNGTVQNAVPGTPKRADTGQPAKNVHPYVKPEGVMTTTKNCSILSPLEESNWFWMPTTVPGGPELGIAVTAPESA